MVGTTYSLSFFANARTFQVGTSSPAFAVTMRDAGGTVLQTVVASTTLAPVGAAGTYAAAFLSYSGSFVATATTEILTFAGTPAVATDDVSVLFADVRLAAQTAAAVSLVHDTGASTTDGLTNDPTIQGSGDANTTVTLTKNGVVVGTGTGGAGGAWSVAPTLADGTHTLIATETDLAGNVGTSTIVFALDRIAPTVTVALATDSGAAGDHIGNSADLMGTAEAGRVVTILNGAATLGTAVADASGTWSFSPTLSDGSYSLTARETDVAGNTGSATLAFMLNASAPTVTVALATDTGAIGDKISNSAALTGMAEADRMVVILNGAATLGTAVADSSGSWSFAPTLADGTYTLTAQETNVTGNTGSAVLSFTLDSTVPTVTVSLASDTGTTGDDITNNAALTGTAEANRAVVIFNGATKLGSTTADASGTWSFSPTLADGAYALTVRETDVAANTGSAILGFTLDTTPPTVTATLAADTGTAGDKISNASILTGKAEVGRVVTLRNGAEALGTATADVSGTWSFSPTLTDGTYSLTASETDIAGNTGSATLTFTLDTAPPTVTAGLATDSGTPGDNVTNASSLTGAAEAGRTVTFKEGATALGSAIANGKGTWSFAPALLDGTHSLTAFQSDIAGNVGSATFAFMLDRAPPVVGVALAMDSGKAGDKITHTSALIGSAEPGRVVTLLNGGETLGTTTADASGAWSFSPALNVDATYTLTARQTDSAGNTGSSTLTFTLDTTPPTATIGLTADTGIAADGVTANASVTGTAAPGAKIAIAEAAQVLGTATANGSGTWAFSPTLGDGSHTLTAITAPDTAGNIGSASVTFLLDRAAPVVTVGLAVDSGTPSDNVTNDESLVGTAEAGRIVTVRNGSATLGVTTADASGHWTMAPILSDGAYTLTAGQTDLAGNTGSASLVFTLDQSAPKIRLKLASDTGSDAADKYTADASISGSGFAGGIVTISEGGLSLGTAAVDAKGSWSYASTLADGTHTLMASEPDAVGNVGSATVTFTLDTTPPVAAPNQVVNSDFGVSGAWYLSYLPAAYTVQGWTPTAGAGVSPSAEAFWDNGYVPEGQGTSGYVGFVQNTGSLAQTLTGLRVGATYDISFYADARAATAPAGFAVAVDNGSGAAPTTVLSVPTIIAVDQSGSYAHPFASYAASFVATAPTETVIFAGRPINPTDDMSVLIADVAVAEHRAGQHVTLALKTDSGAPGDNRSNSEALIGTAESGRIVTIRNGTTNLGAVTANASGSWTFSPTLADGAYTLTASETDLAGNIGSATLAFVLDATLPIVSMGLTTDTGISGDRVTYQQALTGKAEIEGIVSIWNGAASLGTAMADSSGTWSFAPALSDGTRTLTARQTDLAGNTGTATLAFKVDTVVPQPTIRLVADTGSSQTDTVTNNRTLTGTAEAGRAVVLVGQQGVLGTATANTLGTWTFAPSLLDGQHTVTALQADVAGNVGSATLTFTLDRIAPTAPSNLIVDSAFDVAGQWTWPGVFAPGFSVPGWSAGNWSGVGAAGVTPANGAFWDNGYVPDGQATSGYVGFVQVNGALRQTLHGLTVGKTYDLSFYADARAFHTGDTGFSVTLTDESGALLATPIQSGAITASGIAGDYAHAFQHFVASFVARTDTEVLVFRGLPANPAADSSVLFADVAVTEHPQGLVVTLALAADTGVPGDNRTKDQTLTGTAEAGRPVVLRTATATLGTATADASGNWSFTPTISDGTHTVTASETDIAGNIGSATLVFALDRAAPVITAALVSDTGDSKSDKNTANAKIGGIGAANAIVTVSENATILGSTTADAKGSWSFAPTLPDGLHVLTANQTDASGNTGSKTVTVTLDRAAPNVAPNLVEDPFFDVAGTWVLPGYFDVGFSAPGWTGSASAGVTPANGIFWNNGSVPTQLAAHPYVGFVQGTGTLSQTIAGLVAGATYSVSFYADARVAFGGGGDARFAATMDSTTGQILTTLVPDTVVAAAGVFGDYDRPFQHFRAFFTAVASTEVLTFRGSPSLPGADTTVLIGAVELAAPGVSLSLKSDSGALGDNRTNDESLVGRAEAGRIVTILEAGKTLGTATADAAGDWSFFQSLSDATHTLTARQTDAAGNTGSATLVFTLDSTATNPTVALLQDTGDSPSDRRTNDPALTGSAEAGRAVTIRRGTEVLDTVSTDVSGTWSYLPTLQDGRYTLTAEQTDLAGNTGSRTFGFTLDTSAPTVTVGLKSDSGTDGDGITNDEALTGTAEAGRKVSIYDGTTLLGRADANTLGTWSFAPKTALPNGLYVLTAKETDAAGNTGSQTLSFEVDRARPQLRIQLANDTGDSDDDRMTRDPALSGSAEKNRVVTILSGGTTLGTTTTDANGDWHFTPTTIADGTRLLTVQETDIAGNIGSATLLFTLDRIAPLANQPNTVRNPDLDQAPDWVYPGLFSFGNAATGWSGVGSAGISPANGGYWNTGNVPGGQGTSGYVGFVQGRDSVLKQTLTGLIPGLTYSLSFYAEARAGNTGSAHAGFAVTLSDTAGNFLETLVPGTTIEPSGAAGDYSHPFRLYDPYVFSTMTFVADTTEEVLSFVGLQTNTDGDTSVLFADVEIVASPSSTNVVGDPGFNPTPNWVHPGLFSFGNAASGWSGVGSAGISPANGVYWNTGNVPSGQGTSGYVGFVQGRDSVLKQTLSGLIPGLTYSLSFYAEARAGNTGSAHAGFAVTLSDTAGNFLETLVPGTTIEPSGSAGDYSHPFRLYDVNDFSTMTFVADATEEVLSFVGLQTNTDGDTSVLFADVEIVASPPPANVVVDPVFNPTQNWVHPGLFSFGTVASDWSGVGSAGISPANGVYWNTGNVPGGQGTSGYVGFVQGRDSVLKQTLTGLVPGWTYDLSFYAEARAGNTGSAHAGFAVTLSDTAGNFLETLVPGTTIEPSGSAGDYSHPFRLYDVNDFSTMTFVADATEEVLSFVGLHTTTDGDTSVLFADVDITAHAPVNVVTLSLTNDSGDSLSDHVTRIPNLDGKAEAGRAVTLVEGATTLDTVTANASGSWSYAPTLVDGRHTVTAFQADIAGNIGSATLVFDLDRIAPTAEAPNLIANSTFNVSGTFTYPGYLATNAASGWSSVGTAGISPSNGAYWDNGSVPGQGRFGYVGFTQFRDSALQQTLTGLVPGARYDLSFYADARVHSTGTAQTGFAVTLSDAAGHFQTLVPGRLIGASDGQNVFQNAFQRFDVSVVPSLSFVAESTTEVLSLINLQTPGGEATVLFADVELTRRPMGAVVTVQLLSDAGDSAVDRLTNDSTLTGAAEVGRVVTLLRDGTPLGSTTADANGRWTFSPPSGLVDGSNTITARQLDVAGNTGSATFTFTRDTVKPTLTASAGPTTGVGNTVAVGGIALSESGDTANKTYTVTLTDADGYLEASPTAAGGGGTILGSGSHTLTIKGTLGQINADLSTLRVATTRAGTDTITIDATDAAGNKADTRQVALTVNGKPTIATPIVGRIGVGLTGSFAGIVVSETGDTANETFTATLKASSGTLSATTAAAGGGGTIVGSGTGTVQIVGSLAQINADLTTLKATPTEVGAESVQIEVTDSFGNVSDLGRADGPVTGKPVLTLPSKRVVLGLGVQNPITGVTLSIADVGPNEPVSVTITSNDINLIPLLYNAGTINASFNNITEGNSRKLIINGTISEVNQALTNLGELTDGTEVPSSSSLSIHATDSVGSAVDGSIKVTVNGKLEIDTPDPKIAANNWWNNVAGISFSETGDPDADYLYVNVWADHGKLTIGTSGSSKANTVGNETLQLQGTIKNLNTALDKLGYYRTELGADTIHISATHTKGADTPTAAFAVTTVAENPIPDLNFLLTKESLLEGGPTAVGTQYLTLFDRSFDSAAPANPTNLDKSANVGSLLGGLPNLDISADVGIFLGGLSGSLRANASVKAHVGVGVEIAAHGGTFDLYYPMHSGGTVVSHVNNGEKISVNTKFILASGSYLNFAGMKLDSVGVGLRFDGAMSVGLHAKLDGYLEVPQLLSLFGLHIRQNFPIFDLGFDASFAWKFDPTLKIDFTNPQLPTIGLTMPVVAWNVDLPTLPAYNPIIPGINVPNFPAVVVPGLKVPGFEFGLSIPQIKARLPDWRNLIPSLDVPDISVFNIPLPSMTLPEIKAWQLAHPDFELPTVPSIGALIDLGFSVPFIKSPNFGFSETSARPITLTLTSGANFLDGRSAVTGGGTEALWTPTITADAASAPFAKLGINIAKLISVYGQVIRDKDLENAKWLEKSYSAYAAGLEGSLEWIRFKAAVTTDLGLKQSEVFTPLDKSAQTVEMSAEYRKSGDGEWKNLGSAQTGALGDTFTYTAPASESGRIHINAKYHLKGTISSRLGLSTTSALRVIYDQYKAMLKPAVPGVSTVLNLPGISNAIDLLPDDRKRLVQAFSNPNGFSYSSGPAFDSTYDLLKAVIYADAPLTRSIDKIIQQQYSITYGSAPITSGNVTTVGNGGASLTAQGAAMLGLDGFSSLALEGDTPALLPPSLLIGDGGTVVIAFGGRTLNDAIAGGGIERIEAGGIAEAAEVEGGGQQIVESGGLAIGSLVSPFGLQSVESGGTTTDTILNGGTQDVRGLATGTTVEVGGLMIVGNGGTATAAVVHVGGILDLNAGAVLQSASIAAGGTVIANTGYTLSNYAVADGVVAEIAAGGAAVDMLINAGGVETIDAGGTDTRATIGAGGTQLVAGTALNVTIGAGGLQIVLDGGVDTSATIASGGAQIVDAGGTDIGSTVLDGGYQFVAGLVVGAAVRSGARQDVAAGGITQGVTIESGGQQSVADGGEDDGATVLDGGIQNVVGIGVGAKIDGMQTVTGIAVKTAIRAGGVQIVFQDGGDFSATIATGGEQDVAGTAYGTMIDGGDQVVLDGGTAANVTIVHGRQIVVSGATAVATDIGSGLQSVQFGGTALDALVGSGGTQTVAGTASNTAIGDGGTQSVVNGGTVSGSFVGAHGTWSILGGGTASGATIQNTAIETVALGGIDRGSTIQRGGGQTVFGIASDTTVAGGTQTVAEGGTASHAIVTSGGRQDVAARGTARDTEIATGGTQVVAGTAFGATIDAGGRQTVAIAAVDTGARIDNGGTQTLRGTALNTAIAGGAQIVEAGATATGAVVTDGGRQYVSGTATNTILDNGYQSVFAGGSAIGTMIGIAGTERVYAGGSVNGVTFTGAGGLLILESPGALTGTLTGWQSGATIDFVGMSVADATVDATSLTISDVFGGSYVFSLSEARTVAGIHLSDDGDGGTLLSLIAPLFVAPDTTVLGAGRTGAIAGISLEETGELPGTTYIVSVTSETGILSAAGAEGNGTDSLTIRGTLTEVDAALATLTDTEALPGTGKIVLTAADSNGYLASDHTIAVAVNDVPALIAASTLVAAPNLVQTLGGMLITETGDTTGQTFVVTLSAAFGTLSATGPGVVGAGTHDLTVTGLLADVTAALATATVIESGLAPDQIVVDATDGFGNSAARATIAVTVRDRPIISGPGTMVAGAGQATALAGIELSPAAGAADETFTVVLTAATGILSAMGDGATSGAVTGDGTNRLTIVGSAEAIGLTLTTLLVTEAAPGSDTITIEAVDGQHIAAESRVISIATNGVPILSAPDRVVLGLGGTVAFTGIAVTETGTTAGEIFAVNVSDSKGVLSVMAGTATVVDNGSASVTIMGDLAAVGAALATLTYTGAAAGADTVSINAVDSFGNIALAVETAVVVNDAPMILAPADTRAGLNIATALVGGRLLADGDTTGETFTVTVSDTYGMLAVVAGEANVTGNGTTSLTISGGLRAVSNALWTLAILETAPVTDTMIMTATDGFGNAAVSTETTIVVNGPPVLTPPNAATIGVGRATAIGGAHLTELGNVFAETFTVVVSDTFGLLSVDPGSAGVLNNGGTKVTITGTLDVVDAAIGTLTVMNTVPGEDTITVSVSDSLGGTATVTTAILVNSAPVVAAPGAVVFGVGKPGAVSGIIVTESGDTTGETFTVVLGDSKASLAVAKSGSASVIGNGSTNVVIGGSLADVNATLATLTVLGVTPGSDTLDIAAFDSFGNAATMNGTVALTVNGLPVVTSPATRTIGVGRPGAILGVSIAETGDTANETFTAVVSASAGILTATKVGSTSLGGNGTKTLTIAGSLADVNATLATLTDTNNTPGSDTIIVAATDGFGNAAAANGVVALTVNSLPTVAAPSKATMGAGKLGAIAGVSVTETGDTATVVFTATVTAVSGILSAMKSGSASMDGNGTKTVTIAGSLADVNATLATLTDTVSTPGSDMVIVSAVDGFGNAAATNGSVAITVNGLPTVAAPSAKTVGIGKAVAIAGVSIAETGDLSGTTVAATVTAAFGILSATKSGSASLGGAGTKTLTIAGSLADVNASLASLANTESAIGYDTISVSASDSFGNAAPTAGLIKVTAIDETKTTLVGSAPNTTTTATGSGQQLISQSTGQTLVGAAAGGDVFFGGSDTRITAAGSGNTIFAAPGNHTIALGANNNTLTMGAGNNTVSGTGTGNTVIGGNGNNIVTGLTGGATVVLGNGDNTVTLSGAGNKITVGTGTNKITAGTGGNETVIAGDGANTVTAGGSNNMVTVGNGANTIVSTGSSATIVAGNGGNSVTATGTGTKITTGSGSDTINATVGSATISAGLGLNAITFAKSGNLIVNQGGTDTLTDKGTNNTIVLPTAGFGLDIINGPVLTNGDVFDLRTALSATSWNHSVGSVGNYLLLGTSGANATVSINPTGMSGGPASMVAILNGAGSVNLNTFLAHATIN